MSTVIDHPTDDTIEIDLEIEPFSMARPTDRRLVRNVRSSIESLRHPTRSGVITALIAALTGALYTWHLSAVGYANSYYAAAVKSATVSWKAFFFGAIDPGSFITVDKPPAALWIQALFARVLGFSSFSMLLPEALAGVGSVLIVHHLVRRWRGNTAAHLAAIAFAVTPIATAMFRNNNPDAFLTFLGLAAAWALWKALETGRTRMLVIAAALTGLAFETKMLQAFLVLPAFIVVYLVAGPLKLGRRIAQLFAAVAALIISSGWWMAIVALWPVASRPYIGSTTNNSIVSLLLGYNGLDRVFGSGTGTPGAGGQGGGPGGGGGFGGTAGWLRMFNSAVGGQVSWLIPLAVAGLLAGLWQTRHHPRTDLGRAGWLLWGGWAMTCIAVFSLSKGIFHPYYTVQLAPAVAVLAAVGALALWQLGRSHGALRVALPIAIALTAAWAVALLQRTPTYASWLRPTIVVAGAIGAAGLLVGSLLRNRPAVVAAAGLSAAALLAGPTMYSLTTVAHPMAGALVAAGPASGTGFGAAAGGAGGLGRGGPGTASTVDTGLVAYLEANQGDATYLVATVGAQSSASIIIATGKPVITIGGFNGGDPAPTLEQFRQLVAEGKVRYLLAGGNAGPGGGGNGGQGSGSAITQWASQNGTQVAASEIGATSNATLYDLSARA